VHKNWGELLQAWLRRNSKRLKGRKAGVITLHYNPTYDRVFLKVLARDNTEL